MGRISGQGGRKVAFPANVSCTMPAASMELSIGSLLIGLESSRSKCSYIYVYIRMYVSNKRARVSDLR